MSADFMVMSGAPPPAIEVSATAPATTSSTAGASGEPFAQLIAAAIAETTASVAPTEAGVAVPVAVLPLLGEATGDEAAAGDSRTASEIRPDRDAEAEAMLAALTAALFAPPAASQQPHHAVPVGAAIPVTGEPLHLGAAEAVRLDEALPALAPGVPASDGGFELPPAPPGSATRAEPIPADLQAAGVTSHGGAVAYSGTPVVATPAPNTDALATQPETPAAAPAAPEAAVSRGESEAATQTSSQPAEAEPSTDRPEEPRRLASDLRMSVELAAANAPATPRNIEASPAATTVPSTLAVDPSDGAGFASSLADTVHSASLMGDRELRINLTPPDLGALVVSLVEHEGGAVSVAITASSSEAHDLLQQQLPALRAGLEAREVRVERLQVEHIDQQAATGGYVSDREGRQPGSGNQWEQQQPAQWSPLAGMTRADASSRTRTDVRRHDGRVDLRA